SRCLLGLAPTGGCRAAPVARRAVGSYPTFSPLPFGEKGGLFSVALSVALRRPGVTWQSALRSSDFPQRATPAGAPRPSHPTASRRETYEQGEAPGKASAPTAAAPGPHCRSSTARRRACPA